MPLETDPLIPKTAPVLRPPQAMRAGTRPLLLERALLGYILVVIALLTLSPFRFAWPVSWEISWWGDRYDAPANFLLFLPVGYFFRLAMPRALPRPVWYALLFGGALSLTIETLQMFLPVRLTSLFDLLSNAGGSAAGAALCNAARRHLDRELPSVLTFEHPLLQVLYLTLPLMWLSSVALQGDTQRVWLLAPLGVAGAAIVSGLWRDRFADAIALSRPMLALAVLAWFLFGAVAGLHAAPHIVAQCAALVVAATLAQLYLPRPAPAREHRVEHRVLAAVWPCYIVYLFMLVLLPHAESVGTFTLTFTYPEQGFNRGMTLRIAEQLAALTLFGYLFAESCGRSRAGPRARGLRNMLAGIACALLLELVHGFLPGDSASVARWLLGSAAAAFGAMLYAQRLDIIVLIRSGARRY